jgi:hypothetical protein
MLVNITQVLCVKKYVNMHVCKYASMQLCKYSSMQVCKLADMQVCKYAWRVESLICLNHRWRAATGLATFHHRQAAETHTEISVIFFKVKNKPKKNPPDV